MRRTARTRLLWWLLPLVLLLVALVTAAIALLYSEAGLRWVLARVGDSVSVQAVHGRLIGPIEADGVRWRGDAAAVEVSHLELDWSPWRLLDGTLHVTTLHAGTVTYTGGPATTGAQAPAPELPLGIRIGVARVERLVVERAGSAPFELRHIELAGAVDRSGITLETLKLQQEANVIEIGARLAPDGEGVAGELHWSLRQTDHADGLMLEGSGPVRGNWRKLRIEQAIRGALRAQLQAELRDLTEQPRARVELQFEELALARPALRMRGAFTFDGTPQRYTLQTDTALALNATAQLRLTAQGHGDSESLQLTQWRVSGPVGEFDGSAQVSWETTLAWQLMFAGRDIDPGQLWPDWPGRLGIEGQARGGFGTGGDYRARFQLARVDGDLRGQAVSGGGAVSLASKHYRLERLDLSVGSARLNATGEWNRPQFSLNWRLNAPDLAALWPRALGTLTSEGRVRGAWPSIDVAGNLHGRKLAFAGYRAETLDIDADLDTRDAKPLRAALAATGIDANGRAFAQLRFDANGHLRQHHIGLVLTDDDINLDVALDGALEGARWRAVLAHVALRSPLVGDWRTPGAAAIDWSGDRLTLEQLCLQHEAGRLCLGGEWRRQGKLDFELFASAVPVELIKPLLPEPVTLTGTLEGSGSWRGPDIDTAAFALELEMSAGELQYASSTKAPLTIAHAGGQLRLRGDARRAEAHATFALGDGGHARLDLGFPSTLLGLGGGEDRSLSGRLSAELQDVAALAAFVPRIEQARGRLSAELQLAGNTARPQLSGNVTLAQAACAVPDLGIRLRDITLALVARDGGIDVTGEARSGEGTIEVGGSLALRERTAWEMRLQLRGRRFEAANTSDVALWVSPTLDVQLRPYEVDLAGEIHVPRARIHLKEFGEAATISPDVVVVAGEREVEPLTRWAITTKVKLTLDDKNVHLEGFDFAGGITGDLLLEDRPQRPTIGTGELKVTTAQYQLYGRKLDVERGRMIFAGGPIDDPGLDVRAVRRIVDSNIVAGVRVRGTLKRPELMLFSEPAMNETDVLSYIMLGRPAETASQAEGELLYQTASAIGFAGGELIVQNLGALFGLQDVRLEQRGEGSKTAVVVGTYLSPRLYVSYGTGVFEDFNTFQTQYRLSESWLLQTESGTSSGADILYTIER